MKLRNGKMYSSTPTMEEEAQEFRPLTPVTVQVQQDPPPPVVNRPQPVRVEASARLPNPMPTFSIPAPTNQGPRAFFRSSGIFQPSSGTYVPFPELLTPVSPPLQQSASHVPPTTNPVLVTPATVLYTSAAQVPPYDTRMQPTDTEFVPIPIPEPSTSAVIPPNENLNTAFLGETCTPPFTATEPFRTYIPSTNTVACLKRQLNKLEAENSRLRKENEQKYAELERAAQNTYRQTEERILQLERYIKEGGHLGTHSGPRNVRPDDDHEYRSVPSTSRGGLSSSHRTFSDDERLTGNENFKEWAEAVMIELQVTGILQVILSELAGTTDWPLQVKSRADAVARSLILHSVDSTIRPQVRGLPSAYQMWNLLSNRYNVTSTFEGHRIMSDFHKLDLPQAGSALELIRKGIILRDKYNRVAPTVGEFFWTSTVLRKLLPYYPEDSKLLMRQHNYTLDLIHRYFSEFVFDSSESLQTNVYKQILSPSDPFCNVPLQNVHQTGTPRIQNNVPLFLTTGARSAPSSQQYPPRFQSRSTSERQIPIRAFNQSVPILLPPRLPPPPGTPHSGHGPPADGNRCIGCGISGHNTYNCPYQNIPFCYGCKRFGHIRSQCRPEWVADLPGDAVMPNPPEIPQWALNPVQRPAIQQGPTVEPKSENGKVVRLSSFSKGPASSDTFILDTGASYHVVNNPNILSSFSPQQHSRVFYTAEGKSTFTVIGTGVLTIQCKTRTHSICLTLRDVLVAPAIPVNVLSVAKLCEHNLVTIVFTDKYASFCRCEEIKLPLNSSPSSINQPPQSSCVTPDKQSVVVEDFCRLTPPREYRATYYSTPFFSVPRNIDNLYSFVLSVSKSINIPLSYSSIYSFEETIPEGMCQAHILVLTADDTTRQSRTDTEPAEKQDKGDNQIIERPKYRNKSGGHKDYPSNKLIAPPPDQSPIGMVTLWHQRLAHASLPVVKQFLSQLQPTFKCTAITNIDFCDVCIRTKLTHKTHDKIRVRPTRPAEVIAADIIGPVSPVTLSTGFRFILTMIDVYTKYARIFLLKRKCEAGQYVKVFFDMAKAQYPGQGQLKWFCTDNGTEFTSEAVKRLLREYGVEHRLSEPDISAHNGVIERFNRTLEVKTRSLLAESGFPSTFWGLAAGVAEYLYNRTPHSAIDFEIPYTRWTNTAPRIDDIAIFGSVVYHLQKGTPQGRKFDETSRLSFLVGYTESGYLVYDPHTGKTSMACKVKIDESRLYRHIFPPSTQDLQWDIRVSSAVQRQQKQMHPVESVVTAEVHVPPENVTQTSSTLPSSGDPSHQSITIELSQDVPFSPNQSRSKNKKYRVTVKDAPDTDSEEKVSSDSEISSDEEHGDQNPSLGHSSLTSYRSIDLSDCSLPRLQADTQPSLESTAEPSNGVQLHMTELQDTSEDSVLQQLTEGTPFPDSMVFQGQPTPLTPSGQFLFPLRIPDWVNKHDLFEHPHPDAPKTISQALKRPDAEGWKKAMNDELASMRDFRVWEEVPRSSVPSGIKILPWKWVFTYKEQMKPKARLVIVGSLDSEVYDVADTFSPVAPPYVIRWFLAYTHKHNYDVSQIDIKTAFLHSELLTEKYAFIPQGLQVQSSSTVLKLRKAAYGLATSPLLWFRTFTLELKNLGFVQSLREPCLLYKRTSEQMALVIVYVDDVLVATSAPNITSDIIASLEQKFWVKRLGFPRTYVGFEIDNSTVQGCLVLHQRTYATTFLDAFLPPNERGSRKTPMNTFGNFPSSANSLEPLSTDVPYKSIIGTLYYYANATRPDILFAVNYLSRVQAKPLFQHWMLLQNLLRYINATSEMGLSFSSRGNELVAYVDADFGSDVATSFGAPNDRAETFNFSQDSDPVLRKINNRFKSTTGCLIQLYGNPVAWLCRKQPAITTSTTEAEFVAVAEASTLITFLRELTLEVEPTFPSTVSVYEDNLSTTTLLRSIFHHGRLKHLALRFLRVKELIWNKILRVIPVDTRNQLADVFTKPLPTDSFVRLRPAVLGDYELTD